MTVATREERTSSINPWATFGVAGIAQIMVILDASITNVALPSIGRGLHMSQADLQWVVNIYVLIFGGFLLLGGRAGDLFGRRNMFIAGLSLFSLASFFGGLSQNETQLLIARGVQGLGGAVISPVSLAIVSSTFAEGADRNRALGLFGSLAGAGGAIGVLLGGILTTDFGWRWVLFVNVPIGIVAILLAPRFVPADHGAEEREGFDVLGALAITAGLVSLVYGVVKGPDYGWTDGRTIGFFVAAAVLMVGFVVIETRIAHPLVRLTIFSVRNLTIADIAAGMSAAGMFAMFFFLSLYMQIVLGYSALSTGVRYLPLAMTIIVSAGLTSQLVTRFGYKWIMALGLLIAAAGMFLLTQIRVNGDFTHDVLLAMIVVAFGLGMTFVPLQIASVHGVKQAEIGLVNAFLQIGGAIGLAVLSTIYTTQFTGSMAATQRGAAAHPGVRPSPAQILQGVHSAMVNGFHHAFLAGTLFLIAGAIVVAVLLPQGGHGEEVTPPVLA